MSAPSQDMSKGFDTLDLDYASPSAPREYISYAFSSIKGGISYVVLMVTSRSPFHEHNGYAPLGRESRSWSKLTIASFVVIFAFVSLLVTALISQFWVDVCVIPQGPVGLCWRSTVCAGREETAFPGIWDQNSFSPTNRTIQPTKILTSGNKYLSTYPGPAKLQGNGSLLIFDFGKEVGGIVTVKYNATGRGSLGLAFTEARNWTGEWSDGSNGAPHGRDGAIYGAIKTTSNGSYTMPDAKLRGGFRYLTLFATTNHEVEIDILNITLELSFQPTWRNLRAYGGYFHSSDELINRIWYSGAYTLQTNSVPLYTGRQWPLVSSGWWNNACLGSPTDSVFVDGSKRDRTVWSGDLCIAVPSILVSLGDFAGVKNSLQLQFDKQTGSGELPMAGPPLNFYGSDTYHMSTMIAIYDYILYTNDTSFLASNWSKYMRAMTFISSKIDRTGMLFLTGNNDWGRYTQGGHNTEGNMLMYRVLTTGSNIALWAGRQDLSTQWTMLANALKASINSPVHNWDPAVGAFKDSDRDARVHPEDGNSIALAFGGADSKHVANISQQLTTNWGPIGAVCPELSNNIVGYVQSFEVKGHLAARQATRALALMRLSWGWYLNNPDGTGSTNIEGYLADGSFGYRATTGYAGDYSYPSHAHGWSTGPTEALSTYIVGIQLTAPGGKSWILAPQFGDLTSAEGGLTTPLGKFSAGWKLIPGGYNVTCLMPNGTAGTVVLPASMKAAPTVVLDNKTHDGGYDSSTGLVTISVAGGLHRLTVLY